MIRHTPQVEAAAYFQRPKSVPSAFWFALLGLLETLIFFALDSRFPRREINGYVIYELN
jgi:hypothetical protein